MARALTAAVAFATTRSRGLAAGPASAAQSL